VVVLQDAGSVEGQNDSCNETNMNYATDTEEVGTEVEEATNTRREVP